MITSKLAAALAHVVGKRRSVAGSDPAHGELAHALAVAALVLEDGGSEAEAVAALLHHTLDHPRPLDKNASLERQFGSHVAALVEECADSLDGEPFAPVHRRRAYLERLRRVRHATRILVAHEVHHARELLRISATDGPVRAWLRTGAPDLPVYHRELVATFREAGASRGLVAELDEELKALETRAAQEHTVRVFYYPVLIDEVVARCMSDGSQVWSEQWTGAAWERSTIAVADILSTSHAPWPTLAKLGIPDADW